MMTVETLEKRIADAVQDALRPFAPGLSAAVTLRHPKRKVKRNAPSTCWNPENGDFLEIGFEPGGSQAVPAAQPATATALGSFARLPPPEPGGALDARVERLVQALLRAEDSPTHRFVSLKWFRDQALAAAGVYHPEARELLNAAIRAGLVLTRKEANPHHPEHPVTAVYLNRRHPAANAARSQGDARRFAFEPIEVRGEPVSVSMLRDRR